MTAIDGLKWFGDVDLDEPCYSFNLIGVWRDPADGSWLWAEDRGCSCPRPFEDFTKREDLTPATPHEIAAEILKRVEDETDDVKAGAVEFIARMMDARGSAVTR